MRRNTTQANKTLCVLCAMRTHTLLQQTNCLYCERTQNLNKKKSRHREFYSVYKQLNRFSGFRFRCCCCVFADLWNKQYTLHTRFNHRSFQLFYFQFDPLIYSFVRSIAFPFDCLGVTLSRSHIFA